MTTFDLTTSLRLYIYRTTVFVRVWCLSSLRVKLAIHENILSNLAIDNLVKIKLVNIVFSTTLFKYTYFN